jgi:hypothetical protein
MAKINRAHSQTGIRTAGIPGFTLTMEIVSTIIREVEHDPHGEKFQTIGQHIDAMIAEALSRKDRPSNIAIDLTDMAELLIPDHRGFQSLNPHGDHFANAEPFKVTR